MTYPRPGKGTKMPLPRTNASKGDISDITKKMIFILKDMVFLLNYLTDTLERAQEAATRNVTQEKLFLEILQNLQKKTCARASFLIRLQT